MTALLPALTVIAGILVADWELPVWWPIGILLLLKRPGLALLLAGAWLQRLGYGWTQDTTAWESPAWALAIQSRALDLLGAGLPELQARLLGGMLLGRTAAGFSLGTYQHWTDAGMAHLLVASGAQVTLLVFPLVWVLHRSDLAPRFRRWLALAILAQIAGVLILTGLDPSILRAASLAAWLLTGIALGIPVLPLHGLARVATCWLLLDPGLLTNGSFQLSYAATFGLLMLTPLIDDRLPERTSPGLRGFLLLCSATFCAQLAVSPVIWSRFGRVEPVGLLTNLVAVPLAEMLIWIGMLKAALMTLGVGEWLNPLLIVLLRVIDGLARWGSLAPTPDVERLPAVMAVGWLLGVALIPWILAQFHRQPGLPGDPQRGWRIERSTSVASGPSTTSPTAA